MGKENAVSGNVVALQNGPVTCARASGGRASSSEVPTRKNQKRGLGVGANTKRAALEEKKANAPKKRAVLRDVTNVCCENSYRSCLNAVNVQIKNIKQIKRERASTSKVAPSEISDFNAATKAKTAEENVMAEAESRNEPNSVKNSSLSSDMSLGTNETDASCLLRLPPRPPRKPATAVEKSDASGSLTTSGSLKFIDIDSDHTDPQLCSLYAPEIYYNLRVAELKHRPYPDFMERIQEDITQSMRGILVDWLVDVSEEYKLVPDTLYLTVYLIDCFLYRNYVERQRLRLLGITCMLIASKYEEFCAPRIEEFCFITDNTYTRDEVLEMENQVLRYFSFQIYSPTSKAFLRRFLRAAQASNLKPSLELECLANYLAELTLIDYDFLKFLPSVVAASAVFLAKWTLDQSKHPWDSTLEHYTSYKASDLKASAFALQDLQMNTNGCPLKAIRMKYRQEKFKSVAALTSPKLLGTLF